MLSCNVILLEHKRPVERESKFFNEQKERTILAENGSHYKSE